ncbi:hypothetical protein ABC255_02060 [Neobacillus sp. 3P2-tot-E-2]|uniref:hypothetical protein n=1 Tax=Neobacillus sp. 3P2-tot-E-2 TaxID=3132212 RepID=UPI00399FF74F
MRIRREKIGLEFGIALLLLSIPISQIAKLVFGLINIDVSAILLIISLFLIGNKTNLIGFKFPSMNRGFLIILGFQVYCIIIAIYANIGLFNPNFGIIYIIFTMVLILLISTNRRKINYELTIKLFVYISGIFNILLLYFLTDGLASLIPRTVNQVFVGNVLVADRLTLSTMAYFLIIALITFRSKNNFEKLCSFVFVVAALLNIIATSRRGLMVALILILIVHFIYKLRQNRISKTSLIRFIRLSATCFIAVCLLFIVLSKVPELRGLIESFIQRLSSSLITFFGGGTSSSYDSASYSRVLARQESYLLLSEASILEILFGFGYMNDWIDFPFLQAIIDMGIIFGFIYIYIQSMPIIYTISKKHKLKDGELFFFYLAIVGLLNNFYSGIPYGYYKYVYLIPFIYVMFSEIRKINK